MNILRIKEMSDNHPQLWNDNPFQTSSLTVPVANVAILNKLLSPGVCEVQHLPSLAANIGSLFMSNECSDVTLKVDSFSFPAHRVVLAARSEYFRALLFNGMRESKGTEVEIIGASVEGFKMLLKYIYTAKLSLNSLKEEVLLDLFGLAHKYGISELELSISEYLKAMLNVRNVCTIYGVSSLYSLRSLEDVCLDYADLNAAEIISTPSFIQLSASALEKMIGRDSFCAPEIDIFKAVREWALMRPDQDDSLDLIISKLRLPLMQLSDLLNVVRPSGFVCPDVILDAIRDQQEKKSGGHNYRGFLLRDLNVLSPDFHSKIWRGDGACATLTNEMNRYDLDCRFTSHTISERNTGIVIELERPFIINNICILLWDRDHRSYSYYVEVRMDSEDWIRIIDHRKYLCRSRQRLYFSARTVKFIRITGTANTDTNTFHFVNIEAMYSTRVPNLDPVSSLQISSMNVATIANDATVIEGVSRSGNALINGDTSTYDWDNGYTCHQLGSGAIVVQLPQPYLINSMQLLLWDCDDRHYSYYIEVSVDKVNWTRVADHTVDQCRAWQLLRFDYTPIVFIRIVGTFNSANEVFHCVHFECPAQRLDVTVSPDSLETTHETILAGVSFETENV